MFIFKNSCPTANELLNKDEYLKRKWKSSRAWFFNEMEKVRDPSASY